MARQPSPDPLRKIRRLEKLAADLRRGETFHITRLTVLKGLCDEPPVANRFVTYLARKTLGRVRRGRGRSKGLRRQTALTHRRLMAQALAEMERGGPVPDEARRGRLRELLVRMRGEQDEHEPVKWGSVRVIHDPDLLLFEYAVQCLLRPYEAGHWGYQTARHYAERYDSRYGTGLIPESAPLVQDIAAFWRGS